MSLAFKAGLLALVTLLLTGCTAGETRHLWRTVTPLVGAIVDPSSKPQKPRKVRQLVTKD